MSSVSEAKWVYFVFCITHRKRRWVKTSEEKTISCLSGAYLFIADQHLFSQILLDFSKTLTMRMEIKPSSAHNMCNSSVQCFWRAMLKYSGFNICFLLEFPSEPLSGVYLSSERTVIECLSKSLMGPVRLSLYTTKLQTVKWLLRICKVFDWKQYNFLLQYDSLVCVICRLYVQQPAKPHLSVSINNNQSET